MLRACATFVRDRLSAAPCAGDDIGSRAARRRTPAQRTAGAARQGPGESKRARRRGVAGLVRALAIAVGWLASPAAAQEGPQTPAPAQAPRLTRAPRVLVQVPAIYPEELRAAGVAGDVMLSLDLDAEGAVTRAEVVSAPHPALGEAAATAARQLRFSPATIDDLPAAIRIAFRTHFRPPPPSLAPAAPQALGPAGQLPPGAKASGVAQKPPKRPRHRPVAAFETVVREPDAGRPASAIEIDREELRRVPGSFGDPVRVIENLPGMGRAPGGLGGQLLVRGANPADTQVLIDGVPVPLLYHFFALTSVVNSQSLERVDFYPGGFSARYGRAIAGIVEVTTREVACPSWGGVAKVDLIDAAVYTCVPLGPWHVAAALRRSYIDAILPAVLSAVPRRPGEGVLSVSPAYYDYQAKAQAQLGHHMLSLGAYGSQDGLTVARSQDLANVSINFGLNQGFHRLMARDRWRLRDGLHLTSSLSPGFIPIKATLAAAEAGAGSSFDINTWTLDWREELRWQPRGRSYALAVGLDHRWQHNSLDVSFPLVVFPPRFPSPTFDYTQLQTLTHHQSGLDQAYWIECVWRGVPRLTLVPGLRLESLAGDLSGQLQVMPRLSARVQLADQTIAKGAWGRFAQMPAGQYLSTFGGNPRLQPQHAQHFIAGVEQELPWSLNIDMQGFYNQRWDLVADSRSLFLSGGQAVAENYSSSGVGHTYGLELMLRRQPTPGGRFSGWVAYTLSRSLRRDHPDGALYVRPAGALPYSATETATHLSQYDQTHILTTVGQLHLPRDWRLGFRMRFVTGTPYTPSEAGQAVFDADQAGFALDTSQVPINSARLPAFVQLDLRADKTFTFKHFKLEAYLDLVNATMQKNIERYAYDYRYRSKAAFTLLPILPVFGAEATF